MINEIVCDPEADTRYRQCNHTRHRTIARVVLNNAVSEAWPRTSRPRPPARIAQLFTDRYRPTLFSVQGIAAKKVNTGGGGGGANWGIQQIKAILRREHGVCFWVGLFVLFRGMLFFGGCTIQSFNLPVRLDRHIAVPEWCTETLYNRENDCFSQRKD